MNIKKIFAPVAVFISSLPFRALAQGFDAAPTVPATYTKEDLLNVLARLIGFAAYILGAIAVLVIFYAGYLFMTAGDSQDRQRKGKDWLKWGVIGIVVSMCASVGVLLVRNLITGQF